MALNAPHILLSPHCHLDTSTAVTFARYLLVVVQSGIVILASANAPLKATPNKRARHARSWRVASGPDDVSLEVKGCKLT